MPLTLLLAPLNFQTFRHPSILSRGYKSQRLEPNLYVLAERASMAASCLHLPSKSHRGIAKYFVQVNSLLQINAKTVIRTQKEFFSYYRYVFTYRVKVSLHGIKSFWDDCIFFPIEQGSQYCYT